MIEQIVQRFLSNLDEYSQGAAVLETLELIESLDRFLSSNDAAVLEKETYGNEETGRRLVASDRKLPSNFSADFIADNADRM